MSLITIANIPNLLRPGLHRVNKDYNTRKGLWMELYHKNTSDKESEWEQEMYGLPNASFKDEGDSAQFETMGSAFMTVYEHQYVSIGYSITRKALKDNLYKSEWPKGAEAIHDSLGVFKDEQGASVFNLGFSSSAPIADGQPFFSMNHPTQGGPVSNTLSIPTQLNETSLQDIIINIQLFRGASGLYISYQPRKLAVPPSLQFTAEVLLGSKYRTGTANNDISAIYSMGMVPEGATMNVYLTGNSWYLLTTSKGLNYFMREPVDMDSYVDLPTQNVNILGIERYSFGTSNFRACAGVQGA